MNVEDIKFRYEPVKDGTRWQVIIEREVTTLHVAIVDHADLGVPHDPDSNDALDQAVKARALAQLAEGTARQIGSPVEDTVVMTWCAEGGREAARALDYHTRRHRRTGRP